MFGNKKQTWAPVPSTCKKLNVMSNWSICLMQKTEYYSIYTHICTIYVYALWIHLKRVFVLFVGPESSKTLKSLKFNTGFMHKAIV